MMNVIFATDDNYARFAATSIVSLVRTHTDITLNISILDSGMTKQSRDRMLELATNRVNIKVHDMHRVQALANRIHPQHTYLSPSAFSRLFIPELLPNEQRALYLDSDVLVLHSLLKLYHSDMKGKALCMVRDINTIAECSCRSLGVPRYFNSGMILFDLERCRRLQFTHRWLEYLNSLSQPPRYADQDVINVVSQQEIAEVPPCYNTLSYPPTLGNTESIRSAWKHVVVLHFISELKPWLAGSHPFEKVYLQTMLGTPWANDVPELRRNKLFYRLRHYFFCWQRCANEEKEKKWTLYVLFIPLFARFTSPTQRKFYLFGIPIFAMHRRAHPSQ